MRGVGYTICPEVSVTRELSDKSLVRLNWHGDPEEVSLIMIWHVDKWCSPLLSLFMTLAEETMAEVRSEGGAPDRGAGMVTIITGQGPGA